MHGYHITMVQASPSPLTVQPAATYVRTSSFLAFPVTKVICGFLLAAAMVDSLFALVTMRVRKAVAGDLKQRSSAASVIIVDVRRRLGRPAWRLGIKGPVVCRQGWL